MYVVLTPLLALACFRIRVGGWAWLGVGLATAGLAMLAGVHGGSVGGDLLVLGGAAVYSLQIVLMERYAPRYDALGFTLVEMLVAFAGLALVAVPTAAVPHGWTVWGALARHRDLRERARVPRPDLGAAGDERDADGARVHARARLGRALRLHARR